MELFLVKIKVSGSVEENSKCVVQKIQCCFIFLRELDSASLSLFHTGDNFVSRTAQFFAFPAAPYVKCAGCSPVTGFELGLMQPDL